MLCLASALFCFVTLTAVGAQLPSLGGSSRARGGSCAVFDPFRILPEGNKYQIGGAFPLHGNDCVRVNPTSVQEIVGIQWALSHWNQRVEQAGSGNGNSPSLGFFAGDSCSRPKESVAQTLRFLDSIGFHEPRECAHTSIIANASQRRLLGVLAPTDADSTYALAGVLRSTPRLPFGVFAEAAAEELHAAGAQNVISTAPILDNYVEAIAYFVRRMDSNLIAIVDNGERDMRLAARTARIAEALRSRGVYISEVISYEHELLSKTLVSSDARIIVSLLPRATLLRSANIDAKLLRARKVWLNVEFMVDADETQQPESSVDFLAKIAASLSSPIAAAQIRLQLVLLRRQTRELPAFSAYFRRVLANNYESFDLLSEFVEQRFNCTKITGNNNCAAIFNNDDALAANLAIESHNVHAALRLIYVFALAAERIEKTPKLRELCNNILDTTRCYDAIVESVLTQNYEFGASDLADLRGETLRFRRISSSDDKSDGNENAKTRNFLIDEAIAFEAVFVERQGRDGFSAYTLFDWRASGAVGDFPLPPLLRSMRSICPSYRANCGNFLHIKRFDNDEIFLSNPRQYALYLAGIFDFHTGPNCEILHGDKDVALPLAFSYELARLASGNGNMSTLEFGALLVDGCSSDRRVMEFLVESENGCYRFTQADRNWTVVAGSTFGYISTSAPSLTAVAGGDVSAWPSVTERFFTSQNSPAPVLTLTHASTGVFPGGRPQKRQEQEPQQRQRLASGQLSTIFSAMPSHRSTVNILLKYLRRMHWEFVNVVVDEADADSVVAHAEFQRALARLNTVCIGDTLTFNAQVGSPARVLDESAGAANVTLIFAAARSAADYLSARLRRINAATITLSHVHVLVGEAHDFYLHDSANAAHYAGAVSVQAKDMIEPEFREWLASVTPLSLPETWFWRYVEERWRCALSLRNINLYQGRMCTGDELLNVAQMGRMTKAGYLAKSTRIFVATANKVYRRLCGDDAMTLSDDGTQPIICEAFMAKGRLHIRNLLAQIQLDDQFEVLEFQPIDHHGNFGYVLLANYSSRTGFHFLSRYRSYINNIAVPDVNTVSRCSATFRPCAGAGRRYATHAFKDDSSVDYEMVDVAAISGSPFAQLRAPVTNNFVFFDAEIEPIGIYEALKTEAVRYVLLALTTVFCVATAAIFVLVVVKMYFHIVKGNQSLGISLLIGVFLLYASAYAYIVGPTETVCSGRVAAHAIAHTICFGVLLTKALQLRNAEALSVSGRYVTLSYLNYWLLLLFVIAVQAVLWLRWVTSGSDVPSAVVYAVNADNDVETDAGSEATIARRCSNSTPDFFLAEAYALVLLILALLLNSLNRNIKRNYKEAKWLFAASMSCTIIFLVWIMAQALLHPIYTDYATVIELYLTGTALLVFVFGPKIYVLLSYEPIIVECKANTTDKAASLGGGETLTRSDAIFTASNRHYDLFEADWPTPPESRTISPAMSTRAASPVGTESAVMRQPRRRPRGSSTNSGSSGDVSLPKEKRSMTTIVSQLAPATLSTSPISSYSDTSTSDSEALSRVLQTVLRKKTARGSSNNNQKNNNATTVRRAVSQTVRHIGDQKSRSHDFDKVAYTQQSSPFHHHHGPWASYDPSTYYGAQTHYASFDAPLVVLPHIMPTFGVASATLSTRKKRERSASQKSARI